MASLPLFYSKNVYFPMLIFHIFHVIASFVTLPLVSSVEVLCWLQSVNPNPYGQGDISSTKRSILILFHDFFTTNVT